ncbi:MAG TPA: zinc-dependent metalloprotease [Blastocatellia bacterium]|nr:zinc-dependent metalloprotease [Blastocatellia bacterium]
MRHFIAGIILISALASADALAQTDAKSGPASNPKQKTFAELTAGLRKIDGYVPLYWDESTGKMLMEISRFNKEFLLQLSLPAGLGSNDVGLDRGQLGNTHIVYFQRIGPKVLMISPNYRYRAITNNTEEQQSVRDSFATSVLWGFKVEAVDGDKVLVDATQFFVRDAHGVIDRLRQTKQGQFKLDDSRSAFYLDNTKGFPLNTEVETVLTFTSEDPGFLVRMHAPDPKAVTLREHYSLVQLPEDGYKPRAFDPRVGVFGIEFFDYGSPPSEPIEKRWMERHWLQKKDPNAAVSEPVKPIVYYIDPGAPEAIRQALAEGVSWWNEAFEAAGFKNAFQVKILPSGADPMDIRYNMVDWVDRSTRGWSYGASVSDPRTGEIIKANVTLGSLRSRQDFLIGSGLAPLYSSSNASRASGDVADDGQCDYGSGADLAFLETVDPNPDDVVQLVLARTRQLGAHEVGHTLGLAHNFAASTYGQASVMDYPAPMVEIKNGKLDFSHAYSTGVGAYDKFAIKYAYSEFKPGADEKKELEQIIEEGEKEGMLFISDADARPAGAAHPLASLWDNGSDPIAMLKHEMEVRRIGLEQFGLRNLPNGAPLAMLEQKLVPLYLHHRFQMTAAAKSLGGVYYTYAVRTPSGPSPSKVQEIVPADRQREALNAVLETITPDELALPKRILDMIPPRAFGFEGREIELFGKRTDPVFDPTAAASTAADMAISALLEPHRAARLIEFHSLDKQYPGFDEVIDALLDHTWYQSAPSDDYHTQIAKAVAGLTVERLIDLAADPDASSEVRAAASAGLRKLVLHLNNEADSATSWIDSGFKVAAKDNIDRFLSRPDETHRKTKPIEPPPGDPIGTGSGM